MAQNESNFYTAPTNFPVIKNLKTDYGVDNNFSTDDSQALQNAINDVTTGGGGKIIIPAGKYSFKFIKMKSNVHLEIDKDAIIRPAEYSDGNYSIFELNVWRPSNNTPVKNISIRGIGGRFTIDLRYASNKNVVPISVSYVDNFLLENIHFIDNYTKFSCIGCGSSEVNGVHYTQRNGIVKNCDVSNAGYGYGLVQTSVGENILFKNLEDEGGITLRLESGWDYIQRLTPRNSRPKLNNIYGRNIRAKNGQAAVMLSPHTIEHGKIDVRDITAIQCEWAVIVEPGFATDGQEEAGIAPGFFPTNSVIADVKATYGDNAKVRVQHLRFIPCNLRNKIGTKNDDQGYFPAPSCAAVFNYAGGYNHGLTLGDPGMYKVQITNVQAFGFQSSVPEIVNGDHCDYEDCGDEIWIPRETRDTKDPNKCAGTTSSSSSSSSSSSGGGSTCGNNPKAWVYQHCNYGGYQIALNEGSYNLSQLQNCGVTNDDISSVKLAAGYRIIIYQHGNFTGFEHTLTANDACLNNNTGNRSNGSSWNDDISSIRIEQSTSSSSSGGSLVHMKKRNALSYAIDGGTGGHDGQNVKLWSQNSVNVNQQWEEINRGNGYYSYKKANTNYCIDGGSGGANGQNVYLWTCSDNNQNQHWKKVDVGSGSYRLEKRNASGFSIDGNNGGANNQNVYLWTSNNNNQNQHWTFASGSNTSSGASSSTSSSDCTGAIITVEAESFSNTGGTFNDGHVPFGANVNGSAINWVNSGDWMDYNVNIPSSGDYSIAYQISSPITGSTIQITAGGASNTTSVPNNGVWDNYVTLNASNTISLDAGNQTIRLTAGAQNWTWNLDKFTLTCSDKQAMENIEHSELRIYPNPVTDELHITFSGEVHSRAIMMVYNCTGMSVASVPLTTNNLTFTCSHLMRGMYIVKISNGNKLSTKRFFKL